MGRKRVFTDRERDKKKKICLRKWRENNREKYNAYMRDFNKKNNQAAYMREYREKQRVRMFEEAFERVMDSKDGFETKKISPGRRYTRTRKQVKHKHLEGKYFSNHKWQNKNRPKVRAYNRDYYQRKKVA